MKFDNQLRYATTIIADYKGEMPLHTWLKTFFRDHPQMGSKDRRVVSNMVYGYYRLGHTMKGSTVSERILTGLFLCHDRPQELLQYFKPQWNERAALPLEDKMTVCRQSGIGFDPLEIFPWKEELSEDIDHEAFCLSFLRQPDLFLRIRPGCREAVLGKLAQPPGRLTQDPADLSLSRAGSQDPAPYEFIPPSTLRLPNGFKVEDLFTPDKEVVVQDYSSQRLGSFLQMPFPYLLVSKGAGLPKEVPLSFWDACAASGGKSILAFDLNPGLEITVSDIRESILHNLHQRFRQAGIKNYHSFVANLVAGNAPVAGHKRIGGSQQARGPYDLILADVPCSGSGTWSRTPEELYFFDPARIRSYQAAQIKIARHTVPALGPGAYFVYSTCSVFKKENEEIATFLRDEMQLQPDRIEYLKGYDQRADSMFGARFRRPA